MVRVSHVTASLKAGASSFAGLLDDALYIRRGGPAKVRYREHNLFGFLRRRVELLPDKVKIIDSSSITQAQDLTSKATST